MPATVTTPPVGIAAAVPNVTPPSTDVAAMTAPPLMRDGVELVIFRTTFCVALAVPLADTKPVDTEPVARAALPAVSVLATVAGTSTQNAGPPATVSECATASATGPLLSVSRAVSSVPKE